MSRMSQAAAKVLKASFAFDSHVATFTAQDTGSSFQAGLQIEAAPQDDLTLMQTPVRHDRFNGAVLASSLASPLQLDDEFEVAGLSPYAGTWRVDSVPKSIADDDPYGLIVRFEACRA